ncbi:unnamed protein product, partial [Cyprideis torosa]
MGSMSTAPMVVVDMPGRLIGFDRDSDAIPNALADDRLTMVQQDFRFIKKQLQLLEIHEVDGILADL